ncbi:DoxX family protein [Streptomyces sp. NPDC026672]|uniref:DoxX family protein n=1 Tax=unclassified Streptomyces TaxID=2593676 RepID=UPI0033DB06B9
MTFTQARVSESGARTYSGSDSSRPAPHDVGLLLLRLVLGTALVAHGAQKLFGWFGGGGIDGTAQFFEASGYPAARFLAVVAGLIETAGGIGLALGLLTPLAAAAVLGDMINAIGVKWGGGFFAPEGVEYELLLACAVGALTLSGPGRIAADRSLPLLREHRLGYGGVALLVGVVTAAIFLVIRN